MRSEARITPWVLWTAPLLLIPSMVVAFQVLVHRLGFKTGYLAAFLIYWSVWGALFPLLTLGSRGVRVLLEEGVRPGRGERRVWLALLAIPPLLAAVTVLPTKFSQATPAVILGSAALALVNGILEELLWRGLYVWGFPELLGSGYLYPAIGFALWHLAPQAVHPTAMPGGVPAFLAGALFFGLCWGWVARRSRSIRWVVISHVLTDFLGLGALVYLAG